MLRSPHYGKSPLKTNKFHASTLAFRALDNIGLIFLAYDYYFYSLANYGSPLVSLRIQR